MYIVIAYLFLCMKVRQRNLISLSLEKIVQYKEKYKKKNSTFITTSQLAKLKLTKTYYLDIPKDTSFKLQLTAVMRSDSINKQRCNLCQLNPIYSK